MCFRLQWSVLAEPTQHNTTQHTQLNYVGIIKEILEYKYTHVNSIENICLSINIRLANSQEVIHSNQVSDRDILGLSSITQKIGSRR